jgi:iron complex outermembrane recepter protein
VDPERLTAYELGLKTRLPDGRGFFNASAFYYDYRDMQVRVGGIFTNPDGSLDQTRPPFFYVENAGRARIYGLDLQLTRVRLADHLTFDANATLLDAEFRKYLTIDNNRNPVDYAGNSLPRAPKFSGTSSLTVERVPVGGWGEFTIRGELNYRSRTYFDQTESRVISQGAVLLLNASARLEFGDGKYALTAQGRNLTQKRFFDFFDGRNFGNTGEFRTFEIGMAARF